MVSRDPRYATFPAEVGVPQLRWLIDQVANGNLPVEELIQSFRGIHEAIEHSGGPQYTSKAEARLIWDLLWALEFYAPDRKKAGTPEEWNDAVDVLVEVKRVAKHLKDL